MTTKNTTPQTDTTEPLADRFAPHPDFTLSEDLHIDAPPARVYQAVGELRPTDVRSTAARLLVRIRGLPELLHPRGHLCGLDEVMLGERGILLGERPGREIVLGAAGRFWTSVAEWYDVTPETFRDFAHPHSGTIAMAFSVTSQEKLSFRLAIETWITVADLAARPAISLYWHAIRPAARIVNRALIAAVATRAAALASS